jgi:hypothetical protein
MIVAGFRVGFTVVDQVWFSFSLIPCLRLLGCGWVEHNDRFMVVGTSVLGFGTLLGPEKTPLVVFFLAAPGLDRLTHPDVRACVCGWVWWWLLVGWGVVVC